MLKTGKRNIILIIAAFLLCGFLHVFLYGRDFADSIVQLYTGAVVIIWAASMRKRVTDPVLRRFLQAIAFSFLILLVLQGFKYIIGADLPDLARRLWYGWYIPMMAIATGIYYISVYITQPADPQKSPFFYLPLVFSVLITAGVITNDLHFLAFRFFNGLDHPNDYRYGPFYYLYAVWFTLLLLSTVVRIVRKQKEAQLENNWFLPVLPAVFLVVFLLLVANGKLPVINGVEVWKLGELYCFGMIAFLEFLILAGMIPANSDYEKIFAEAALPVVILDHKGEMRYCPEDLKYPFADHPDLQIKRHPIPGGQAEWALDVGKLRALNAELEETAQKIRSRNEYLSSETKVKEERTSLQTRNRIYDDITWIVSPQLEKITELLQDEKTPFNERLKKIAVLSAFIKRRGNMALQAENGMLPFEELTLAVSETLLYLRLKGTEAVLSASGSGLFPEKVITDVYSVIEEQLENSMDLLEGLLVVLKGRDDGITMRMMIRAAALDLSDHDNQNVPAGYKRSFSMDKEDGDWILTYHWRKQGEHYEH